MTSVEQEQAIVKRSSLILGDSLMIKEGMASKMQMIYVAPAYVQTRSTVSFPLMSGKHQRLAMKVIRFRENEVVRVMKLQTEDIPYAYS
jgi:hypothetical protein